MPSLKESTHATVVLCLAGLRKGRDKGVSGKRAGGSKIQAGVFTEREGERGVRLRTQPSMPKKTVSVNIENLLVVVLALLLY